MFYKMMVLQLLTLFFGMPWNGFGFCGTRGPLNLGVSLLNGTSQVPGNITREFYGIIYTYESISRLI